MFTNAIEYDTISKGYAIIIHYNPYNPKKLPTNI